MTSPSAERIELTLGFSPDADDVAMWWPIVGFGPEAPALATAPFRFRAVTDDIESLNRRSMTGELDITAMSCAQYGYVADTYAITACGCSMGDRFGPKLVGRPGTTVQALRARGGAVIAVPGERTTAFAALSALLGPGSFDFVTAPFDAILGIVERGEATAGLLIHETQLTFAQHGLTAIADVATMWAERYGLPLPLGINTIRRDLDEKHGEGTVERAAQLLHASIAHAMTHPKRSFEVARQATPGELSDANLEAYLARYVNAWTLDLGAVGRLAVERLLEEIARVGLAPKPACVDVVEVVPMRQGEQVGR